ncbi:MAG: hypothetical protein M3362_01260 [Acidobacteriota bacterium]|nr:hypothetical protein [Acidobacteriota bacterium]
MFKVGDRVRIKKSSVYAHQNSGNGVIIGESSDGWVTVKFDDGYDNSYIADRDLESVTGKGKRGRPRTKAPKVNFLLKYDLDEDPIEEFETMDQVKERIDHLVKNESSLKKESMVVYEVKRKKVVSIQTKITMK